MPIKMSRLLVALLLLPICVLGQDTFEGQLLDHYRKPIDYANITNLRTAQHCHSDRAGNFSLENARIGDSIEISHLLYEGLVLVLEDVHFEAATTFVLKDKRFDLGEVVVENDLQSMDVITQVGLATNPVNSSQEILRQIPGLFIGQHAGGGKAEQIFLRGFDIDHGTDIRIGVDGIPVNMVSHAHGQGYADLHFLIPETIDKINFGKGPYYTQQGNFATAGYVNFKTKEKLDHSMVGVEYGRFNTLRLKSLINLLEKVQGHEAYLAASFGLTDGPFESSQNFHRVNLFGKYIGTISQGDKIGVQASYFTSRWDASGQIPQRAVERNLINRFGAIDDTEGGETSRTNIRLSYQTAVDAHTTVESMVYYSNYNFELYSNFTFFLNDSINGDQIKQRERRNLFGGQSELKRLFHWKNTELLVKGGIGFRHDISQDNELSHTLNRKTVLEYRKLGNIFETNVSGWLSGTLKSGAWRINLGTRIDYFRFNYENQLDSLYSLQATNKVVASPKLNLLFSPHRKWQLYLKTGIGFHSNDTRVAVSNPTDNILPAAYGADLGTIWKPFGRLMIDAALWVLYSEQEMVYVGDEAIVEPSGQSLRTGADLGIRYQVLDWLFLYANVNYTYARSLEEPQGQNYIPLAPDLTSTGGVSVNHPIGISGGLQYRYMKDRPANEDNSIVAQGYAVVDMNISYQFRRWKFGVVLENLFNTDWNEAQFATESRLPQEAQPVEELHFTPGTPFFIKGVLEYHF